MQLHDSARLVKKKLLPVKPVLWRPSLIRKGVPVFTKTLTVTTDADTNRSFCKSKRTVETDHDKKTCGLNKSRGHWRVKVHFVQSWKSVYQNEYVVREFQVANGGKKAINYLGSYDGPVYIRVNVEPKTLQPGEIGIIRIGYNGKVRNAYGLQSDNVVIHTDDENIPCQVVRCVRNAGRFSRSLHRRKTKAPKLLLNQTALDFGRVNQNQSTTREVTISNLRQSPLELRSVRNCTCICNSWQTND